MKQVIVVRTDLKMKKGKIASQAAHASISAYEKTAFLKKKLWMSMGQKKIVLKTNYLEILIDIEKKAKKAKIASSIIRDAGLTQIEPNTITAIGIGPDEDKKIDLIIPKELKLL
ncbi:MAG: aminoacyl-tRNA hydrolase [Candidatus Aenigmarchaeota archaeon ex4484_52]|nr:MAG: aminoacyl-tRNA hydrolase [Candidatus Aenigmarchaeota archaeon ex4484_52]